MYYNEAGINQVCDPKAKDIKLDGTVVWLGKFH